MNEFNFTIPIGPIKIILQRKKRLAFSSISLILAIETKRIRQYRRMLKQRKAANGDI